jgi:hypothetical protein
VIGWRLIAAKTTKVERDSASPKYRLGFPKEGKASAIGANTPPATLKTP